jgi:hypothetical protein
LQRCGYPERHGAKKQAKYYQLVDMEIPRPVFPKEHGAWAVLFVPLMSGAAIAGGFSLNVMLLALSALGMFLWTVPAQTLWRQCAAGPRQDGRLGRVYLWGTVYLAWGIAFLLPLFGKGYWLLGPLGLVGAVCLAGSFFQQGRFPRTIAADLISVVGLTLSGLAAYYVTSGKADLQGFLIWVFNILFFGSSVFYVHMKIGTISSKNLEMKPGQMRTANIVYQSGVLVTIALFAMVGVTRWLTILAFIPMGVHVFYGTFHSSFDLEFKKLGLLLLGQSILFGILLWVSLR